MLNLSPASREDMLALSAALPAENAQLPQRVQALQARLGHHSSNSSRPPQRPPGHQRHRRQLSPEHR